MNCFNPISIILHALVIFALTSEVMALSPQNDVFPSFILTGKVSNIPDHGSKTMIVNECDIAQCSSRQVVEVDSLGYFSLNVPINYGHTFTVNYSGNFINAYAEPNDSIHIEIDASQSPISYTISGNHAILNEEYSHIRNKLAHNWWEITLPPDTVPIAEYLPAFKSEVERIQAIIDTCVKENNVSLEVAEMLYIDNLFSIANLACTYQGKGKDDMLAFFTDSLFNIRNEEYTKLMIFPYHLSALIFNVPEYVEQMPKGLIRDIMYIKWAEFTKNTPERSNFANTTYYDRVFEEKNSIIELGKINPSEIVVYENDSVYNIADAEPVSWLIDRFKGQPIYLDISATWCGPCREALTDSEGIREYFSNTDIVFAIVWLRSNLEQWKELIPTIKNAVHIFISDEDASNQMIGKLNIRGFPSYYLINQEGVIDSNVPKYQSPALPDFINELLKK
ncbi:MAG: AhpC/TSA family protein [Bacteroides sp.]|nr:AhpC/TSA family protein [Bacteroides sp.]